MNDQEVKKAIEAALKTFPNQPLAKAASHLFEVLGYTSQKRLKLSPNNLDTFIATFAQDKTLNDQYALSGEWQSIDFLFQLTDDEIRAAGNQRFLFDSQGTYNGAVINSYLFFALELQGHHYTRTALAGITRELNKLFDKPVLILFRHGETLTLAVINRRLHKRDEGKDVLEKVTLIQDIQCGNTHRAHIEILFDLSLSTLHDKHGFTNFVELQAAWQKTLDISALNKRFYQELANWYFWALPQARFPKHAPKDADGRDSLSLIRLITRVIFCWFLKEKGLLPDALFDPRQIPALLHDCSPQESTYYQAILQNLFFATLNQEMGKREFRKDGQHFMAHNLYRYRRLLKSPDAALKLFASIPFMNGGLFECLDKTLGTREKPDYVRIDGFSDRDDNALQLPNDLFFGPEREVDLSTAYGAVRYRRAKVCGLIHTLYRYKFTVAENTPIEEEIALDPELLGKVFENLLAAYNPETGATARKQTGSFYTRREIVNYMVDESLLASLKTRLEAARPSAQNNEERLRHLFAYNDQPHQFTAAEVAALIEAVDHLKILDPACGSGAFPMGILHKLVFVLGKLDPGNQRWKARQLAKATEIPDPTVRDRVLADIEQTFDTNELDYGRKLYLIENCIYGVDIQPIAVQISKLRFFISLIVDQKVNPQAVNLGIRPLPNLETKFVAANTLIGLNRPGQQLLRNLDIDAKKAELRRVRVRHFLARTAATKAKCREQDANLRAEIAELLKNDGWDTATAHRLASWDPYDQNTSAEFFDAEWMFGETEGFDVVIGNPPYVGKQALQRQQPELTAFAKDHFESARGRDYDLFALFIEKAVELASCGGSLSYIVPTGWYTGAGFSALRRFVALKTDPKLFVNLPYDMFEEAWVDTTVFLVISRNPLMKWPRSESCGVSLKTFGKRERILSQDDFRNGATVVDIADWFRDGSDEFLTRSDPRFLKLLSKVKAASVPFGECADIQRGVTPFALTDKPVHPNSRQAFSGTVKRYTLDPGPGRFICFDNSLAEFKPARYFTGPRLLLRELISRQMRLQATFADYDLITNKSMQTLLPIAGGPDIRLLLGVLNSRLISWLFLQRSNIGHRDDFPKIVLKETRELPFPRLSLAEDGDGKRGAKEIAALVDCILKTKQANVAPDTLALEREIDERVYRLYGLTPDEIRLVEESTPSSGRRAEPAPE